MVSSDGGCENTVQSNSRWLCNGHRLKCCVDVNCCQYNYMCVLEVVSLFLRFIDVTSSPGTVTVMEFDMEKVFWGTRLMAQEYSRLR